MKIFTPVLNAPEVGILGVGGIVLKPKRMEDGSVEYVDTLPLSLTIDHQAVDGALPLAFFKPWYKSWRMNRAYDFSLNLIKKYSYRNEI